MLPPEVASGSFLNKLIDTLPEEVTKDGPATPQKWSGEPRGHQSWSRKFSSCSRRGTDEAQEEDL